MICNKKLTENITLLCGELNNWKYDKEGNQIPLMYFLTFRFYDKKYDCYFSQKGLDEKDLIPASMEGDSSLFDSFESWFEEGEAFDEIKKACSDIWELEKD